MGKNTTSKKYQVKLTILGEDFKSQGKTLEEALTGLNLDWNEIKGKGIMNIDDGLNNYEHLFSAAVLRRIMSNKIASSMWAKRLGYLMGAGKQTNIPKKLEI